MMNISLSNYISSLTNKLASIYERYMLILMSKHTRKHIQRFVHLQIVCILMIKNMAHHKYYH